MSRSVGDDPPRSRDAKIKVVFVCLGNSCRSIMAEALARHFLQEEAASAGLSPLGFVTPQTLEVLAEMGVSTEGLRSKGLEDLDLGACQFLINLTRHSLEYHLPPGFSGQIIQRFVRDPYGLGLEAYRQTREDLVRLITGELSSWPGLSGEAPRRPGLFPPLSQDSCVKGVFPFFLRLFACLVAAKFLLHVLGVEGRGYLVGLTTLFTANLYWFDYLDRDRFRPPPRGG